MFLTESTSDNSGHTATLRSAKIRQSRNFACPQAVVRNQPRCLKFKEVGKI
ncbi:MAG: hypothetical protein MW690_000348 [Methanophagales archaeon]|nr:hypothetical protein [Methanophagales archaeon]